MLNMFLHTKKNWTKKENVWNLEGNDHQWKEKCRKSEKPKLGLNSDANYWKITIHSLTEGSEKDQNRVGFSFSIVKLFRTLLELFGRTDQPELTLFIVGGRIWLYKVQPDFITVKNSQGQKCHHFFCFQCSWVEITTMLISHMCVSSCKDPQISSALIVAFIHITPTFVFWFISKND